MNNKSVGTREIDKRIDVLEEEIMNISPGLLKQLLKDRTTKKNIIWAVKDYESNGPEFSETAEIKVELITGKYKNLIQPRAAKSKAVRDYRIKTKAEVFTPSWMCNHQNNLIDEMWFGRPGVFNTEGDRSWKVNKEKIDFKDKSWKVYITGPCLEITCGEGPYIASRYDTTTGKFIPLESRIGFFDRKMRVVKENCVTDEEWLEWSIKALKASYGFEIQGDNIVIARENILYSYIEYYYERFKKHPDLDLLKEVAKIISWNIWQMDGLKIVKPFSCYEKTHEEVGMFSSKTVTTYCQGCKKNNIFKHNGIYATIKDWQKNEEIRFIDMLKGMKY